MSGIVGTDHVSPVEARWRAVPRALRISWAAALLVASGPALGQTWQIEYDPTGGALPSTHGFVHSFVDPLPDDGLGESNYAVAGGLLSQGETGGPNGDPANLQWYEYDAADFDFDEDVIVVELSARIASASLSPPPGGLPSAGFGISVSDRERELVVLYIGETGAFLYGSPTWTSSFAALDTTDGLHDYVLTITPRLAHLSIDGASRGTLDREAFTSLGASVANRVAVGDLTPAGSSSSEISLLRVSREPTPVREVRGYQVVSATTPSDSSSPKSLSVSCPPGTFALTGGASTQAGPDVGLSESAPGPGDPPSSWIASARELVDTAASWDLSLEVVCGEISGLRREVTLGIESTDASQFAFELCPTSLLSGPRRPISGGALLIGADLRQTIAANVYSATPIDGERWLVSMDDFGAGTSSAGWSFDMHLLCTDARAHEHHEAETGILSGSPRSLDVNCVGGKLPIGGGAFGGDGGLAFSRPKDGAPGAPPVGWSAEARGTGAWNLGVRTHCAPPADPTVSARGLQVRLRAEFDANDSWGWDHGSLLDGVGFAPGVDGQAFSFPGSPSQSWVRLPSFAPEGTELIDLYPEGDFTASAWFRTDSSSPAMTIAQLYDLGGTATPENGSTWALRLSDGHAYAVLRAANVETTSVIEEPTLLNDGEWHHMALVRDLLAFELYLYVDGERVATLPVNGELADQPLVPGIPGTGQDPVAIGGWRSASVDGLIEQQFEGEIDDFAYWDRALTPDELQNLVGCHRPLGPRVLNLQADRFSTRGVDDESLCVFLEAGTYELLLVDAATDPDARFSGWSSGPSESWGTEFSVAPAVDPGFTFGLPASEPSAQAAYDATLDKDTTLTLSQAQRVYFSLDDAPALDNRGGVSIRVVPEPGGWVALTAGLLRLMAAKRRRSVPLRPRPRPRLSCADHAQL